MANTTFRDAYDVLQKHAESLRNQREPDIDNLLTIVTESVVAYKVCKERIDAVEKALAQALSNAGVESAGSSAPNDGDGWLDDPGLPRSTTSHANTLQSSYSVRSSRLMSARRTATNGRSEQFISTAWMRTWRKFERG